MAVSNYYWMSRARRMVENWRRRRKSQGLKLTVGQQFRQPLATCRSNLLLRSSLQFPVIVHKPDYDILQRVAERMP